MKERIIEVYDNDAALNNLIQYHQINKLLLVSCYCDEGKTALSMQQPFAFSWKPIAEYTQSDAAKLICQSIVNDGTSRAVSHDEHYLSVLFSGRTASNGQNLLAQLISYRSPIVHPMRPTSPWVCFSNSQPSFLQNLSFPKY